MGEGGGVGAGWPAGVRVAGRGYPTELEVRFAADGDGGTVVEIEHRGWERFGEAGGDRRDLSDRGWSGVIPLYVAACGPEAM